MIFLGLEKINEEKARITLMHNFPEMLDKEMLSTGVLIENLPKEDVIKGKIALLYYNYNMKEVYYEYEDDPEYIKINLGNELAEEKLKNIELSNIVNVLGQELSEIKLQTIKNK
ncbi:hypothetical protein [Clostridium sp. VAP41]|uniref:hypothetical protein n=1 Tax=Clostridium sp. VAP41 TaxID=2949979 RepID=UPI00207A91C7|nr:hypothetical protein [Clostridium sp. VAP41]